MTKILSWLFGVLFSLAFIGLMGLWWENTELQKELLRNENTITVLSVQRDALQQSNNNLTSALTVQNKGIEKLGDVQKDIDKLFVGFNTMMTTTNKQISGIKDSVSKEATPKTCADTIKYLKDARKEMQ